MPQPEEARVPADLLALLGRLRQWSGLPLSEIDERLRAAGFAVPDGAAGMLGAGTLPDRVLLSAFVTTCGLVPEERDRWLRVHDRLRAPAEPPVSGPAGTEATVSGGMGAGSTGTGGTGTRTVDGDRRVAGRPALNMGPRPAVEKAVEKAVETAKDDAADRPAEKPRENGSGRHARTSPSAPRHRRRSRRVPAPHRRVSLLVAAPAIITIAVVASTLPELLGGDDGNGHPAAPSKATVQASPKAAPPTPGWYTITPVTDDERTGNCLSVMPDDRLKPQLAQDKCTDDDNLQRIKLVKAPGAEGTFRLQAWTPASKLWCTTLDSREKDSALHMAECGDDPLQRFGLTPSTRQVKAGRVFDIVPEATRAEGMCVGVDVRETGGLQAVHAECGRTGVRGYLLTPVAQPPAP
ncbi:hypothetical protein [Actinomadura decatromicini]|uniref:hypothetical protein n=1 Tax=Actinomadura decatromicini TaxID=2604572 RepID=UPI0016530747|nr:hypothetical protein [Actinomadura decatromicini]